MTGRKDEAQWPWLELGINESADHQAIRRAYAKHLRRIDQAREPEAFRRLRDAYEEALKRKTGSFSLLRPVQNVVSLPESAPTALIQEALRAGNLTEAFRLFQVADAKSELSFATLHAIEEDLLAGALLLPRETLLEVVERFGWNDVTHPLRTRRATLFRTLDHRLEAERWYGELRRQAASRRWTLRGSRRFAARLMLRGPPGWYEVFGPADLRLLLGTPRRALSDVMKQFVLHEEWLRDRFDPGRIRWCRRRLKPGRVFLGYVLLFSSVAPIAGFLDSHDIITSLIAWVASFTTASIAWLPVVLFGLIRGIASGRRRSKRTTS